jgi:RNA polymerase sigma factor (sigma-70 family)
MELGIPKTNEEMVQMYGKYIQQQVRHLNRRPANFLDILQSVWLKLVEGRVVEKFHERQRASRPDALTTEEVCQHLGITVEAWVGAQEAYHTGESPIPWMPSPVAGEASGLDALWATDDVERYESVAHLYHEKVAASECLIPQTTGAKFRTYLQWAIHNAFANWCRTQSRRDKDRTIDLLVRPRHRSRDEEAGDFDLFDIVTDPTEPVRQMQAQVEVRQALACIERAKIGPMEGDFLTLLTEGYTLHEAARKLRLSQPTVRRIERALQAG